MVDGSRPFFNIDVIMTSQLLFKIILNFFDNFLILLDFANKFNNMSS